MWNDKIEKICINISKQAIYQKKLHDEATKFYYTFENIISILSILIITGTGTTSFATLDIEDNLTVKLLIGIILYLTAVMDSIKKFLKPSQKIILHSNATKSYSNLHHNIQKQLALEHTQRQNAKDYIGWVTRELDNLQNSTPDIPSFIDNKFKSPEDINLEEIVSHDNEQIIKPDMEQIKDIYVLNRFNNIKDDLI